MPPIVGGVASERTGVFLLRVWADGDEGRVRARITHVLDISTAKERIVTAGSREEIERTVREWLTDFLHSGDGALTNG